MMSTEPAGDIASRSDEDRCILASEVRDALLAKFEYLFDGLYRNIEDALFEEMRGMTEEDALARHFNVMRSLKLEGDDMQASFAGSFAAAWQAMMDGYPLPDLPVPEALVQEMIKRHCRSIDEKYRVLVTATHDQLSTLVGDEIEDNPLASKRLFAMFWLGAMLLDLAPEERVLLLPLFHRFVMDRYGQILVIPVRMLGGS